MDLEKSTLVTKDFGGATRDRTADLLNAIQALSQLSYDPIMFSLKAAVLFCRKMCAGVQVKTCIPAANLRS